MVFHVFIWAFRLMGVGFVPMDFPVFSLLPNLGIGSRTLGWARIIRSFVDRLGLGIGV